MTGHYYGIKEPESFDIIIYPNPARDYINIRSGRNIVSAELYNCNGQKVLDFSTSGNNISGDISSYPNGLYFLKVQLKGKTGIYKIIKK